MDSVVVQPSSTQTRSSDQVRLRRGNARTGAPRRTSDSSLIRTPLPVSSWAGARGDPEASRSHLRRPRFCSEYEHLARADDSPLTPGKTHPPTRTPRRRGLVGRRYLPENVALPGPCSRKDVIPTFWSSVEKRSVKISRSSTTPPRKSPLAPQLIAIFAARRAPSGPFAYRLAAST